MYIHTCLFRWHMWRPTWVHESGAAFLIFRPPFVQIYLLLSCCPCEGRISGIVDVPNACATLAIPIAIFDQVRWTGLGWQDDSRFCLMINALTVRLAWLGRQNMVEIICVESCYMPHVTRLVWSENSNSPTSLPLSLSLQCKGLEIYIAIRNRLFHANMKACTV